MVDEKNYYCLPHYNDVNNTQYTYEDVLVDVKWCKECCIKTLCVVGFGPENHPLVEKCKDDVQFYYEVVEKSRNKRRFRVKKRQRLFKTNYEI